MGALALSFTACTESDDAVALNPTYDAQANTVNAKMVFNVATGAQTRMTAEAVQLAGENGNFRGLQDVVIYTANAADDSHMNLGDAFTKKLQLGTLWADGTVPVDPASDKHMRLIEAVLPLQTDNVVLYGFAPAIANDNINGKITKVFNDADPDAATNPTAFTLVNRIGDKVDAYKQTLALAELVVNRCLDGSQYVTYTEDGVEKRRTWEAIYEDYINEDPELTPMGEILGSMLNEIRTFDKGGAAVTEYRAGSSNAVYYMLSDIYNTLQKVMDGTATSPRETWAKTLATIIHNRIANYIDDSKKSLQTVDAIKARLIANAGYTEATFNDEFGQVTDEYIQGYPAAFGLPMGATTFSYDATTKKFSFNEGKTLDLLDAAKTTNIEKFMYPAELCYWVNSPLRTSAVEWEEKDYPQNVTAWDTEASWNAFTAAGADEVLSSTRSIAVKNNINYGTALLKTNVKFTADKLKDNTSGLFKKETDAVIDATASAFTLTGILIGGQNATVDWNFIDNDAAAADANAVIYDNYINGAVGSAIPAVGSELTNYTMEWDNYVTGTAQQKVKVALELVNNTGKDFWGEANLVRNGGTFYLIGELDIDKAKTKTLTWPAHNVIPPYTDDGASQEVGRVFIQDFMTEATLNIGENSLKKAYVTVPNLKSSQLSIALSVDLKWNEGYKFEQTFGVTD